MLSAWSSIPLVTRWIGIEVWRHRRKAKLRDDLAEFNEEHPG